jgi:hypothetical protein
MAQATAPILDSTKSPASWDPPRVLLTELLRKLSAGNGPGGPLPLDPKLSLCSRGQLLILGRR